MQVSIKLAVQAKNRVNKCGAKEHEIRIAAATCVQLGVSQRTCVEVLIFLLHK